MKLTKSERSWILYDWANSAYTITVTTAIFPLFFAQIAREGGLSDTASTAVLGYGNSFYALLIALTAPLLGTLADEKGRRKKLFTLFLVLGALTTLLLILVRPGGWIPAMILYILTGLGFYGSIIFYDASIVDVTDPERMDRISTLGFGWGYVGSTIPFLISIAILWFFSGGDMAVLNITGVRIAFLITALWWLFFSIPFLRNVRQRYGVEPSARPLRDAVGRLNATIRHIRSYKKILFFLLAYFFYIDGVGTIIKMAMDYGSKMGLGSAFLLLDLVLIQILAFPFAILYGRLAAVFSARRMLFVGIGIYTLITLIAAAMPFLAPGLLIPMFVTMSVLVASSMGGIQALSRSYYASLIPPEQAGEFFGFFDIFGKFAAILGPLLMGAAIQISGSYSIGVGCIVILFILGIFFLIRSGREGA